MKKYKEPKIQVNICYETEKEKKCITLSKEDAYALRDFVEEKGGTVWWFTPVN